MKTPKEVTNNMKTVKDVMDEIGRLLANDKRYKEIMKKETCSVNHPEHYNAYPKEVIDMMIDIWGKEKVAVFCEINAFKYRMRAGLKNDIHEDLSKELWYLTKAKELRGV